MSRCRSTTIFPYGSGSESVVVRCQYQVGHIDQHTFIVAWGRRKNLGESS
jgi:hypothetical protein